MTLDTLENDLSTFEPAANEILAESRNFQMPPEAARESLIEKHRAKSARLADYSPAAMDEIQAALAEADAARERADNLISDQQAALDGILQAVLAVGNLRKKIRLVKSLALTDGAEKQLAETALDFFLRKSESATPQNVSGFNAYCDDLCWRKILTPHLEDFVRPLETQAALLIQKIKSEAKSQKMDIKSVFSKFAAERGTAGEPILLDGELYDGLL
jgi:hypothetical protein